MSILYELKGLADPNLSFGAYVSFFKNVKGPKMYVGFFIFFQDGKRVKYYALSLPFICNPICGLDNFQSIYLCSVSYLFLSKYSLLF